MARSTYGAIRACDVGCRGIARGPSTLSTVRASRGRSGAPGGLMGGQFDRAVVSPRGVRFSAAGGDPCGSPIGNICQFKRFS